jgi:uncharacterized protein (TIGR03437 family)
MSLFSTLLDSFQSISVDLAGTAYIAGSGIAPGINKQLINGAQVPASASLLKIDPFSGNAVVIDAVQKAGLLSIPALADLSGPIGIAAGELVTITGHGLGPNTTVGTLVSNGLVSTSLGGASVTFDGVAAPLVSVQNNQVTCVTPYGLSGLQRSRIQLTNNGMSSNAVAVTVVSSAVEVLALLNQDGTINSVANPAPAGSTMTLYVSGLGVPDGSTIDGQVGITARQTFSGPVSITFNVPATITYLGAAPGLVSGITQANFTVPAGGGQSVLSVSAGKSTDFVFVYVQ